jgi:hypothetical protein
MKFLIVALAVLAVPVAQAQVSYAQLDHTKVSSQDCARIDYWVNWAETQLQLKGLLYAEPESLNNEDRLYNQRARSLIWALRIGCANPTRYK